MATPKPGTPEWDNLLHGVLNANTADKKGWTARLADDDKQRGKVVEEIQRHGRRR